MIDESYDRTMKIRSSSSFLFVARLKEALGLKKLLKLWIPIRVFFKSQTEAQRMRVRTVLISSNREDKKSSTLLLTVPPKPSLCIVYIQCHTGPVQAIQNG